MEKLCLLAAHLGVKCLVFGSPKNRFIDFTSISQDRANEIALHFFKELGDFAYQHGVKICIETNPKDYNCNFLTTTMETINFIKSLNSPGVALNFDLGASIMNNEEIDNLIENHLNIIAHFHISEPFLNPIRTNGNHKQFHHCLARVLKKSKFNGIISIEMRKSKENNWNNIIENTINDVRIIYDTE